MRRALIHFVSTTLCDVVLANHKARIALLLGPSGTPTADNRANNQKSPQPSDTVDDREHRPASAKCIVGCERGQYKAEPAESSRNYTGTHSEHVHMDKNAIEHPGNDELTDKYHDERSAFCDARLRVLLDLALFDGLALRSEPGLAQRGVINTAEKPGGNGSNQE